jgi:Ubiquitin interaction motif
MANEDMDEDLARALALSMQEVRPLLKMHLPFTCLKGLSDQCCMLKSRGRSAPSAARW